jgi:signal transduction histidine kinase
MASAERVSICASPLHASEWHMDGSTSQNPNWMKDQFLAMLSHAFRAPLNALLGWADMLKRNVVKERRRDRAIEAIHRGAPAEEDENGSQ